MPWTNDKGRTWWVVPCNPYLTVESWWEGLVASEPEQIPDNDRLGRGADQTIRKMIREEIAREKDGKPIRPYPEKERGGN